MLGISSGMWAVKTHRESSEHVKSKGAMATLGWVCIELLNVIVLMGRTEMALSKHCSSQEFKSSALALACWAVLPCGESPVSETEMGELGGAYKQLTLFVDLKTKANKFQAEFS